jgi:NADH:ubiquinone oxidoreductase subunit F (NADH-binding)
MSVTVRDQPSTGPDSGRRLLHGLGGGTADPSLDSHLDRWGPLKASARLLDQLEASGLAGHGGAWFPVATKWRGVASGSRRRPVVVANGAEGEPASQKDALLLTRAPHLVLDGLSLAASTLRADRAIAYVPARSIPIVSAAVSERRTRRIDPLDIEIVEAPDTYIAGQETAVVNALGRREALPSFAGLTTVRQRGVDGRPTLVQNVETLAHVALIGRFGAAWFRSVGHAEAPGTILLTVTRPEGPRIVEAVLGSSLRQATGITADELGGLRGVLLGGYGGGWVSPATFGELPVYEKAARRAGATLGAGVVALVPRDVCPLAEMADVVRYMEDQGAGQCGPCVEGLAELADSMERLAYSRGAAARPDRIVEVCNLVEGRGACRHPDGVARFVKSGLDVFADEVAAHLRRGPCSFVGATRVLPGVGRTRNRRLVSRA